jgi:hypothetical protein
MSLRFGPGLEARGRLAATPTPPRAAALMDLALAGREVAAQGRARLLATALGGEQREAGPDLGTLIRAAWGVRPDLAALRGDAGLGTVAVLATCPACATALEFDLPPGFALPEALGAPDAVVFDGTAYPLRLPRLGDFGPHGLDLAALSHGAAPWHDPGFRAMAEAALEAADPVLALTVALPCPDCGATADHLFDPLVFVWDELDRTARRLMADVVVLARAFGWGEGEVLALSPARRAAYVQAAS